MAMDPALLKEFNAFKKKSLATPSVEAKKTPSSTVSKPSSSKRKVKRKNELPAQLLQQAKKQAQQSQFNYKTHAPLKSKSRFAILSSCVDHLKGNYQKRIFEGYTLDELLDITKNTDIKPHDKEWLFVALRENPKMGIDDGKYIFKPKYTLKDKKSLVKLLDKHDQKGHGGILLDDIREGLPNADDIIKAIADKVTFVTRSNDKKAVLFHYDPSMAVSVDEEFQKHWRSVAVEGLAEPDIEKYLSSSGITTMQGVAPKAQKAQKRRGGKRKRTGKLHNDHLQSDVLKDYSEVPKKGTH